LESVESSEGSGRNPTECVYERGVMLMPMEHILELTRMLNVNIGPIIA